MTDIGTGSYTILAQIAAETMGVPLKQVVVEIGDSGFAPAPGSGGQFGAASAGSGALAGGMALRARLTEMATGDPASPLFGAPRNSVERWAPTRFRPRSPHVMLARVPRRKRTGSASPRSTMLSPS